MPVIPPAIPALLLHPQPAEPARPAKALPAAPAPVGSARHSIAGGGPGLRYCGALPYLPGDVAVAWRWLCHVAHLVLPWADGNDRTIIVYDATGRPNTGHPYGAHLLGTSHIDRGYITTGPYNHTQGVAPCLALPTVDMVMLDARCEVLWWRLARAVYPNLRALAGTDVVMELRAHAGEWVEGLEPDDTCKHGIHTHTNLGDLVAWSTMAMLARMQPREVLAWLTR